MARPLCAVPRLLARALAAGGWLLLSVVAPGSAALAVPKSADAVVVDGDNTNKSLAGGGSTTEFSIRLPEGASCPGDSEEGQYRVQSFLVPAPSVDPGELQYKGLRPVAEGAWALYRTDTTTFMNALTSTAAEPGGEGAIVNVPLLSFAVFEPGMIAPGRYHLGMACSLFSETKRYWSTEVDVVADAADKPAGITWRVVGAPAETGDSRFSAAVGVLLFVAAVPVVLYLRGRRGADDRVTAGRV